MFLADRLAVYVGVGVVVGITPSDIESGGSFDEVLQEIRSIITRNDVVLGHSVQHGTTTTFYRLRRLLLIVAAAVVDAQWLHDTQVRASHVKCVSICT